MKKTFNNATTFRELEEDYEELNEAVQEALTVLADYDLKLSAKVAKLNEILEPFLEPFEDKQ